MITSDEPVPTAITIPFDMSIAYRVELVNYVWLQLRLKNTLVLSISLAVIGALLFFVLAPYSPNLEVNARAIGAGFFAMSLTNIVISCTDYLFLTPLTARKQLRKSQKAGLAHLNWVLDRESLTIVDQESSTRIAWSAFDRVVETKSLYLFRLNNKRNYFFAISKDAVINSEFQKQFFSIVGQSISDVRIQANKASSM